MVSLLDGGSLGFAHFMMGEICKGEGCSLCAYEKRVHDSVGQAFDAATLHGARPALERDHLARWLSMALGASVPLTGLADKFIEDFGGRTVPKHLKE